MKFLTLWELFSEKMPVDAEAFPRALRGLAQRVKQDIDGGKLREFGVFTEGGKGYMIAESSAKDLYATLLFYRRYSKLTVHSFISLEEVADTLEEA